MTHPQNLSPSELRRALRLFDVCNLTGTSQATVWRWSKNDPTFPKPFRLSAGVTVWDANEVTEWIASKREQRAA